MFPPIGFQVTDGDYFLFAGQKVIAVGQTIYVVGIAGMPVAGTFFQKFNIKIKLSMAIGALFTLMNGDIGVATFRLLMAFPGAPWLPVIVGNVSLLTDFISTTNSGASDQLAIFPLPVDKSLVRNRARPGRCRLFSQYTGCVITTDVLQIQPGFFIKLDR